MFTVEDHCSLSPTEAGVYPATSSMSHTTFSAVRPRRGIVQAIVGTPNLTLHVCPPKMPGTPA
jgi:hypothetical protein